MNRFCPVMLETLKRRKEMFYFYRRDKPLQIGAQTLYDCITKTGKGLMPPRVPLNTVEIRRLQRQVESLNGGRTSEGHDIVFTVQMKACHRIIDLWREGLAVVSGALTDPEARRIRSEALVEDINGVFATTDFYRFQKADLIKILLRDLIQCTMCSQVDIVSVKILGEALTSLGCTLMLMKRVDENAPQVGNVAVV